VPKRGKRLGWTDDAGKPTNQRFIRHSADPKRLFWEPAKAEDAKSAVAAVQDKNPEAVAEKVLGCIAKHCEISQADLLVEAKTMGIGAAACRGAINVLLDEEKITCIEKPRSRVRPEKFYSRVIRTTIPGGDQS